MENRDEKSSKEKDDVFIKNIVNDIITLRPIKTDLTSNQLSKILHTPEHELSEKERFQLQQLRQKIGQQEEGDVHFESIDRIKSISVLATNIEGVSVTLGFYINEAKHSASFDWKLDDGSNLAGSADWKFINLRKNKFGSWLRSHLSFGQGMHIEFWILVDSRPDSFQAITIFGGSVSARHRLEKEAYEKLVAFIKHLEIAVDNSEESEREAQEYLSS